METLLNLDRQFLLMLNGSESAWWDGFWWTISATSTWIPMLLMVAYVALKNGRARLCLIFCLMLALTILLADQISSSVIKPWICRLRPTHDPEIGLLVDTVRGYRGSRYGFVSSHAANTFAVFVFISLAFRSRLLSLLLFVWASMSSYSRIYLGVHFPGDILCGAMLGLAVGTITYLGYHFLLRHIMPQRQFYSSAYTNAGILSSDIHAIALAFMLSYFYVCLRACFL